VKLIMSSSTTLRRRLHHGDVDGRKHQHYEPLSLDHSLREPLLGNNRDYGDRQLQVDSLSFLCLILVLGAAVMFASLFSWWLTFILFDVIVAIRRYRSSR